MNNIFIGFLLIFLDYNLTLNASQIGLIPDFAGYLVMIRGLAEMNGESRQFGAARPWASGMAVYTGLLYALDLFGISASIGAVSFLLGFASTAVSLYISYLIVMGVRETQEDRGADLNAEKLRSLWALMAMIQVVTYLLLLVPGLNVVSLVAAFIISVFFLVEFNRSKNMYAALASSSGQ